jgi:hypothetical protein
MTQIVTELLSRTIKHLIEEWAFYLFMKAGLWLEKKFDGPTVKVVIGMVLGLAAISFIVIICGLIGVK